MNSTLEQLRFASIPGHTIRADFAYCGLSYDLGPLLLRGIDRQIGLTERINAAVVDTRCKCWPSLPNNAPASWGRRADSGCGA